MVLRHYLTQCWNIVNWTLRNSETVIGIQSFSFKKTHLKMLSVKWHQFCLGLNLSMTTCISYVHLIPWLSGWPVNKLHPEAQHSGNKTIIYTGHRTLFHYLQFLSFDLLVDGLGHSYIHHNKQQTTALIHITKFDHSVWAKYTIIIKRAVQLFILKIF